MPAAAQGGVLTGGNPTSYNPADPLTLFIIQVTIIILVTRVLNIALSRIRQPRVISEVIGGIILGPSVLGNIPHYLDTIFPQNSKTYLTLTSNLGLVLYLFLVGVELDFRMFTRNARVALPISAVGMIVPFGLGAAVSYGLYNINKRDQSVAGVDYPVFLLFMGVALAITAFPVLARIITELKLLKTNVGMTALSAAVGDDVMAWVLLALTVSIVNSSNSVTALYTFLLAVAWALILFYLIRPVFLRIIVATGSNVTGPTLTMMSITLLLVLISAFITNIIGVHQIFGAFMVGVIVPHDGQFAVGITERMEDLVNILFLPLYFALSGLNTRLGLLRTGEIWGYVLLVIVVAMFGKIAGVSAVSRLNKFPWRESLAIGIFMSCKGLVELIVLNIGLEAKVISQQVFTIMVVMAIVTTCCTTPLVTWVYPSALERFRKKDPEKGVGQEIIMAEPRGSDDTLRERSKHNKLMVVLNQVEYLPAMMTLLQLLNPGKTPKKNNSDSNLPEKSNTEKNERPTTKPDASNANQEVGTVHALRLIELTQRTGPIMKNSETAETVLHDPIMNVIRTFGQLNKFNVKTNLSVIRVHEFSKQVVESAKETEADLVIIPWAGAGTIIQDSSSLHDVIMGTRENKDTSPQVANFIQGVYSDVPTNIAVFVDRGLGIVPNLSTNEPVGVFFPFFGGVDDREALTIVVRLLESPDIRATILRIVKSIEPTANDVTLKGVDAIEHDKSNSNEIQDQDQVQRPPLTHQISSVTVPVLNSEIDQDRDREREALEEADKAILAQYFGRGRGSLIPNPKVTFIEISSKTPLQTAIERAKEVVSRKDLVVVGRGKHNAAMSHREEWIPVIKDIGMMGYGHDNHVRKSLGDTAEGFLVGGVPASVLVIQGRP